MAGGVAAPPETRNWELAGERANTRFPPTGGHGTPCPYDLGTGKKIGGRERPPYKKLELPGKDEHEVRPYAG